MKYLLVGDPHRLACRDGFPCSQIAHVHGMRAARHLQTDRVAFFEAVCRGKQVNRNPPDALWVRRLLTWDKMGETITDIDRFPIVG